MDSKYSLLEKNESNAKRFGSTKFGLKRKLSYGTSNGSPLAKKPNLQKTPKSTNVPIRQSIATNGSTNGNEKAVNTIQMQRKQLPIYAVRNM